MTDLELYDAEMHAELGNLVVAEFGFNTSDAAKVQMAYIAFLNQHDAIAPEPSKNWEGWSR